MDIHEAAVKSVLARLDSKRGNYAMVQKAYYECFDMIPNAQGRVAKDLLMFILNECRSKAVDEDRFKGTIWSSPMSRQALMLTLDEKFKSVKKPERNYSNFCSYLNDLVEYGVFRVISIKGMYSFTYVHNVFSWNIFSRGKPHIYPGELKRIIASRDDVMGMFFRAERAGGIVETSFSTSGEALTNVVDRPQCAGKPIVANLVELQLLFANFLSFLIGQTPEKVQHTFAKKKLRKCGGGLAPMKYIRQVNHVLDSMDDMEGFDWRNVRLGLLPGTLWNDLRENVLKSAEVVRQCRLEGVIRREPEALPAKSLAYNNHKAIENRRKLDRSDFSSLKVSEDLKQAIFYAERYISKKIGDPDSFFPYFRNDDAEGDAYKLLLKEMVSANCSTRACLCECIRWFIAGHLEIAQLNKDYVFFAELLKMWPRFKAQHLSPDVVSAKGVLYERMNVTCDGSASGTLFLLEDFGVRMTYDFLVYNFGRQCAESQIVKALSKLRRGTGESAKRTVARIFRAGYQSQYKHVFMSDDSETKQLFEKLLDKYGISAESEGLVRVERMSHEEIVFYRLMEKRKDTMIDG